MIVYQCFLLLILSYSLQTYAGETPPLLDVDYYDEESMKTTALNKINEGETYGFEMLECFTRYVDMSNVYVIYNTKYAEWLIENGVFEFFSMSCGRNTDPGPGDPSRWCNHSSDCVWLLEHIEIYPNGSYKRSAG